MKKAAMMTVLAFTISAQSALTNVTGPNSSAGLALTTMGAPAHILDDTATNFGMQGFDETQGVATSIAHAVDGGRVIPAGTRMDSHLIFLNNLGKSRVTHFTVDWTFDGEILGLMSEKKGLLEAASTFELGHSLANHTAAFPSGGRAAPFNARGLERNARGHGLRDGYRILDPFTLRVDMSVTEPGDWMRVVTAPPVPAPGALLLAGLGTGLVGYLRCRRGL